MLTEPIGHDRGCGETNLHTLGRMPPFANPIVRALRGEELRALPERTRHVYVDPWIVERTSPGGPSVSEASAGPFEGQT